MRYILSFVLALVVALGFGVVSGDQASAQDRCDITIEKVSNPANNTEFDFIGPPDFALSDPGNPSIVIEVLAQDDGNRTTIIEDVRPGWVLESIECTPPTGGFCVGPDGPTPCLTITETIDGINIDCYDVGRSTCTFTNVLVPHQVPALSQYGLMALAGVLGLLAFIVIRRKKAAA